MAVGSLLVLVAVSDASAVTLAVGPAQPYTTIADAVDVAVAGDRIEVDAGVYGERPIQVDFDLEIVGLGGAAATSWASLGGGIPLRVTNGAVVDLTGFAMAASDQVVIAVESSTLVATDLEIAQNTAPADAGAVALVGSDVTIEASAFDTNSATDRGGAIFASGSTLTVRTTTFSANTATEGGAIFAEATDVVLESVTFDANVATDRGGAVSVVDGTLALDGGSFLANDATAGYGWGGYGGDGGALVLDGGATFTVTGTSFVSNSSDTTAGGVLVDGAASGAFDGCTFDLNQSSYGGAVYVGSSGDVEVLASSFTANSVDVNGGAIRFRYVGSPTLTVLDSTFEANSADLGGAIAATSETDTPGPGGVVLDDVAFTANTATTGGAMNLAFLERVEAAHLTFCANHADGDGGAVRVNSSGGGLHRWTNSVFTDNTANDDGGAVLLEDAEPAEILNDTFLGNGAAPGSGGGIALVGSIATVTNTLVAFTTAGDGIGAPGAPPPPGVAVTYSAFWDNTAADLPVALAGGVGNVFADPLLTAYSADGDCTNDQVWPQAGSPLVDAGTPAVADPDGSPSDIGAYGGPGADWSDLEDDDQDGYTGAVDCDDADPAIHPDAAEICDGVDQDCDGVADDAATDTTTFYPDDDGDGWGVEAGAVQACDPPPGYAEAPGDCDDANLNRNPAAVEVCNGADDDCDAAIDEDVLTTWYTDADGDGYGAGEGVPACSSEDGVDLAGDCDDADPEVNPGADDPVGDGLDQDCDGGDGSVASDPAPEEGLKATSGCGCASGGSEGFLAVLPLFLLIRRR